MGRVVFSGNSLWQVPLTGVSKVEKSLEIIRNNKTSEKVKPSEFLEDVKVLIPSNQRNLMVQA